MAYTLVIMLLTEAFPLQIAGICAGIIESIDQLGVFLGPIVVTLSIDLQIYPLILLSVIILGTIVFPVFFYESKKPDSL